jgi:hypothetical protein
MDWWSYRRGLGYASLNGMGSKCLLVSMTYALTTRRTTHPIVDSENHVIGLLAGQPHGATDWEVVCRKAADAIKNS